MSDGLTVPFALAAGLTQLITTRIIVTAGLAEIAAGLIAMGLSGLLRFSREERCKDQATSTFRLAHPAFCRSVVYFD
jgi:vacuolar iron transporter family protein